MDRRARFPGLLATIGRAVRFHVQPAILRRDHVAHRVHRRDHRMPRRRGIHDPLSLQFSGIDDDVIAPQPVGDRGRVGDRHIPCAVALPDDGVQRLRIHAIARRADHRPDVGQVERQYVGDDQIIIHRLQFDPIGDDLTRLSECRAILVEADRVLVRPDVRAKHHHPRLAVYVLGHPRREHALVNRPRRLLDVIIQHVRIDEHRVAEDIGIADKITLPVGCVPPPERVPQTRRATRGHINAQGVGGEDRIRDTRHASDDRASRVFGEGGVNHRAIAAGHRPQPGAGVLGDDGIDQQISAIIHQHAIGVAVHPRALQRQIAAAGHVDAGCLSIDDMEASQPDHGRANRHNVRIIHLGLQGGLVLAGIEEIPIEGVIRVPTCQGDRLADADHLSGR